MRLEFQRKSLDYNLDGSLRGTVVTLGNVENSYVPILLLGDKTTLSNQELFDLAMEKFYQENFPQRAENERFSKIDDRLLQFDKLAISNAETIKKMDAQLALSNSSRSSFLKVVMVLYEKGLLSDEKLLETGLFE